jgi:hypothetical protein
MNHLLLQIGYDICDECYDDPFTALICAAICETEEEEECSGEVTTKLEESTTAGETTEGSTTASSGSSDSSTTASEGATTASTSATT